MCEFHNDYRVVTDRNGVAITLTTVQASICKVLDRSRFPRTDEDIVDRLEEMGHKTQTIRHAFRAGEGHRLWKRLIRRMEGVRSFLYLDREFEAGPCLPPKLRKPRAPRDCAKPRPAAKGTPTLPDDVLQIAENLTAGQGGSRRKDRR